MCAVAPSATQTQDRLHALAGAFYASRRRLGGRGRLQGGDRGRALQHEQADKTLAELRRICEDQHKVVIALTTKCKAQETELQRQHGKINSLQSDQDTEKTSVSDSSCGRFPLGQSCSVLW